MSKHHDAVFKTSRKLLSLLMLRQEMKCWYCPHIIIIGDERHEFRATTDHRTPLRLGGDPYGDNVVAACYKCNHLKGPLGEAAFLALRHDPVALKAAIKEAGLKAMAMTVAERSVIQKQQKQMIASGSRKELWEALQAYIPRREFVGVG